MTIVLDVRDLAVPVACAPMAGGPSTPALAAAVSSVGALGFLAAGYKTAEAVAGDMAEARSMTSAPLGVNLFVVAPYEPDGAALERYRRSLEPEAARLGVELGATRWDDDHWSAKLELVLDLRPDVASFTFGCPSAEVLRTLAQRDVLTLVTVTSLAEAQVAAARGAAALSVQGNEAGGHRGTWDLDEYPPSMPLLDLVSSTAAAVDLPLLAGGGLHNAAGVDAVIRAGAAGAQIGTAYLLADEAGTNETHRAALREPALSTTALTRAYTGRWACGLANRFMADHADAPAGYPHLHHLTAPLRKAAALAGNMQVAHLWAGTGHAHCRLASAAAITHALAP